MHLSRLWQPEAEHRVRLLVGLEPILLDHDESMRPGATDASSKATTRSMPLRRTTSGSASMGAGRALRICNGPTCAIDGRLDTGPREAIPYRRIGEYREVDTDVDRGACACLWPPLELAAAGVAWGTASALGRRQMCDADCARHRRRDRHARAGPRRSGLPPLVIDDDPAAAVRDDRDARYRPVLLARCGHAAVRRSLLRRELHPGLGQSRRGVTFVEPTESESEFPDPLPSTAGPNAAIYVFGERLDFGAGTVDCCYGAVVRTAMSGVAPNREFLVEWHGVAPWSGYGDRFSAEVILAENGSIILNYDAVNAAEKGANAVIGIENADGTAAVQVVNHEPLLESGHAFVFEPDASPAGYTVTTQQPAYEGITTVEFEGYSGVGPRRPAVRGAVLRRTC